MATKKLTEEQLRVKELLAFATDSEVVRWDVADPLLPGLNAGDVRFKAAWVRLPNHVWCHLAFRHSGDVVIPFEARWVGAKSAQFVWSIQDIGLPSKDLREAVEKVCYRVLGHRYIEEARKPLLNK